MSTAPTMRDLLIIAQQMDQLAQSAAQNGDKNMAAAAANAACKCYYFALCHDERESKHLTVSMIQACAACALEHARK